MTKEKFVPTSEMAFLLADAEEVARGAEERRARAGRIAEGRWIGRVIREAAFEQYFKLEQKERGRLRKRRR